MRRARIAAVWIILLVISYFYWKWCAVHIHDGRTIRAALIYFIFLMFGIVSLLVTIFRLKPPPA